MERSLRPLSCSAITPPRVSFDEGEWRRGSQSSCATVPQSRKPLPRVIFPVERHWPPISFEGCCRASKGSSRAIHALQPKSAFSCFPLVHRADLEGPLRVESTHCGNDVRPPESASLSASRFESPPLHQAVRAAWHDFPACGDSSRSAESIRPSPPSRPTGANLWTHGRPSAFRRPPGGRVHRGPPEAIMIRIAITVVGGSPPKRARQWRRSPLRSWPSRSATIDRTLRTRRGASGQNHGLV